MGSRILALDLGEKRIGLAVSDPEGRLASGRGIYLRRGLEEDLAYLQRLVAEEGISEVVLGLPQRLDGSLGPEAQAVREFKALLEERLHLPVALFDERLTTAEAERVLLEADLSRRKRKGLRDELAAVLILQGFLDSRVQVQREEKGDEKEG
ncbi:MAG: Holliday junction resolvase RuvX [Candidatus Bipolaricaulia bacterium]